MTEQQTERAISIYSEMLLRMGELPRKTPLCGFMAQQGKLYDGGLMVVGRALNGWAEIPSEDMASPEKARSRAAAFAADARGREGKCPMQWVLEPDEDYEPLRVSAFWRVIKQVALRVCDGASENDWPSHLIWSNLYKLGPAKGGNPTEAQMDAQFDGGCKDLLRLEIEAFSPSHLLFLTGWKGWAQPFLDLEGDHLAKPADGGAYVERSGRLPTGNGKSCAAVVACHPQTRPETDWVDEVLANFKALLND